MYGLLDGHGVEECRRRRSLNSWFNGHRVEKGDWSCRLRVEERCCRLEEVRRLSWGKTWWNGVGRFTRLLEVVRIAARNGSSCWRWWKGRNRWWWWWRLVETRRRVEEVYFRWSRFRVEHAQRTTLGEEGWLAEVRVGSWWRRKDVLRRLGPTVEDGFGFGRVGRWFEGRCGKQLRAAQ